jgi:hypothetical protein
MQGPKGYRKLIAMSQLVVASNNPALSCPLRTHVAHDLRNLLATVGLHLETLQRLSGPSGAKAANAAHALLTGAPPCATTPWNIPRVRIAARAGEA